jgi:hypothetical protein
MIRTTAGLIDASSVHDDYEPTAEWLGGEAWVNLVPTFFRARCSTRDVRGEPAATDWIPI